MFKFVNILAIIVLIASFLLYIACLKEINMIKFANTLAVIVVLVSFLLLIALIYKQTIFNF